MLARLLACLALVTGLAAVGVPANAAMMQAASEQVSGGAQQAQPGKAAACAEGDQRSGDVGTRDPQAKCPRKRVIIYIPTVQFGADRAFE